MAAEALVQAAHQAKGDMCMTCCKSVRFCFANIGDKTATTDKRIRQAQLLGMGSR